MNAWMGPSLEVLSLRHHLWEGWSLLFGSQFGMLLFSVFLFNLRDKPYGKSPCYC